MVLCPETGLSLFDELHSGRRDHDVIAERFLQTDWIER
jgi:hypothetical protein